MGWLQPVLWKPGVWRRKEGGHLVRGRAIDPRTGKIKQVRMVILEPDALVAFELLQRGLRKIHEGTAVEKEPSTGSALTGRRSPSPSSMRAVTRRTKSGAPGGTIGRRRLDVVADAGTAMRCRAGRVASMAARLASTTGPQCCRLSPG